MLFIVLFHKNIKNLYKEEWIKQCIKSLENQTYNNFDIYEINYGNDNYKLKDYFSKSFLENRKYEYVRKKFKDHSYSINYIINHGINSSNEYKYIGVVNLDDYYHKDRFKIQIKKLEEGNFDVVSNNIQYIKNDGSLYKKIKLTNNDNQEYIDNKFKKGDNIIAHPCATYTVNFFKKYGPYPNTVPREDFDLWIKARKLGAKISILDEYLLYYRLHINQTSRK
jgi:hypothetical protein